MGPQKEALGPSGETPSPKEVPPDTPGGQTKRAGLPWLEWVGVPKPGSPNLGPRLLSTTLRLGLLKPSLKTTCPVCSGNYWKERHVFSAWPVEGVKHTSGVAGACLATAPGGPVPRGTPLSSSHSLLAVTSLSLTNTVHPSFPVITFRHCLMTSCSERPAPHTPPPSLPLSLLLPTTLPRGSDGHLLSFRSLRPLPLSRRPRDAQGEDPGFWLHLGPSNCSLKSGGAWA